MKNIVINASPIISLANINAIFILKEIFEQIVVPKGVYDEIVACNKDDKAVKWILNEGKQYVNDYYKLVSSILAWDLGKGETEVITFAHNHTEYIVGIDDRAARNCAEAFNLKVIGTIGILLNARKHNIIQKVSPFFLKLQENGFRINNELLKSALKVCGEV